MTANSNRIVVCDNCGKLLAHQQGQVGGGSNKLVAASQIIVDGSRWYLVCPSCRQKKEVSRDDIEGAGY